VNPPVPIADLFRVLLPRDCPNGWLAMLTAYFDDSGTHGGATIVLVGGLSGTGWQLRSLEALWRPHLERPLCGTKNPVRRFHAYDCFNSIGDFTGWTRTETDYYWHLLETAILDSGVMPYGIACVRQDWDDLVIGQIRDIYGNAEQMCIKNCFVKALQWAEQNTFDPQITFVFDSRPSAVQKEAQVVSHAFQTGRPGQLPQVVGSAFLSSYQILPLQAADLIAWELYQFANDIHSGATNPGKPLRKQLQYLLANKPNFQAQFASRESIKKIIEYVTTTADPMMLRAAANHFRTFDPSSAVSGGQSS
jgi:hypothetical protein